MDGDDDGADVCVPVPPPDFPAPAPVCCEVAVLVDWQFPTWPNNGRLRHGSVLGTGPEKLPEGPSSGDVFVVPCGGGVVVPCGAVVVVGGGCWVSGFVKSGACVSAASSAPPAELHEDVASPHDPTSCPRYWT